LALVAALEEEMTTYKINPDEIPRAMPEIFGGPAARWFRTSHLQSASWETFRREFLDFFLPPRNLKRLEDEIRTHMQRKGESFKTYLIELRTKVQQAGHREEERKHGSRVSAVYQARHDIRADTVTFAPVNKDVGKGLLAACKDFDADMLVMGAYSHSRLRQLILGGVTRHVLEHADITVLMSR